MLYEATFNHEAPATLILGRLHPESSETSALPPVDMRNARRAAELAEVRSALADRRDPAERAMDAIVDRLMKELSW